MNEPRIEELEIKLSFQDELIGVLNQQVSAQELRLIALERKLQVLAEMLLNIDSSPGSAGSSAKAEVPPHY
jgi:SlyX protein